MDRQYYNTEVPKHNKGKHLRCFRIAFNMIKMHDNQRYFLMLDAEVRLDGFSMIMNAHRISTRHILKG